MVAYITAKGTGFAQQQFSFSCKKDGFSITHEALAVARFSKDLASDYTEAVKMEDATPFLAYVAYLRTSTCYRSHHANPSVQEYAKDADEGCRLRTGEAH